MVMPGSLVQYAQLVEIGVEFDVATQFTDLDGRWN
jgi:hypothetical protein